jgi:L-lysine 2,3-aminomutase
MDNSSLMNRENKKRQLRRQIVPPRYQTEEESEQAIRNAHKKSGSDWLFWQLWQCS